MELKYNTLLLLDPGHGVRKYMKGSKLSPDGSLYEGEWNREMVLLLIKEAEKSGIKAINIVPEESDISLRERCNRVNKYYKDNNKNAILVSVHINAAGADGKWHTANGYCVYISPNASKNSKRLAKDIYEEAEKSGLKGNRSVPKEKYLVANLAMCRDTHCPAVLTENMFQDNKEDVAFLLSKEGKEKIAKVIINGVINYLNGK